VAAPRKKEKMLGKCGRDGKNNNHKENPETTC